MIPFMMGAVKAGAFTLALGTLKLLAMKAFLISKLAVIITAVIAFSKFFQKMSVVEVEKFDTPYYPMYDVSNPGKFKWLLKFINFNYEYCPDFKRRSSI